MARISKTRGYDRRMKFIEKKERTYISIMYKITTKSTYKLILFTALWEKTVQ